MYEKIRKLFKLFNINDEEIPLFLKEFNITYADIQDQKSFEEKIDEKLLAFIATELKINRSWLYGNSNDIFSSEFGFYKRYNSFCNEILSRYPNKLYIITQEKPNKEKDEAKDGNYFEIIAEYPLNLSDIKTINRYEIYDTKGCRWGYWRCRWEIKKLFLCLKKHHFINRVDGYFCNENFPKNYEHFIQGELSFKDLIKGYIKWHPADYIEFKTSNAMAQEEEELKEILEELNKEANTLSHYKSKAADYLKIETNNYILFKKNFELEEFAKRLSNHIQTKFILLENEKSLYTDNEYILQLLRFQFEDFSDNNVLKNTNISYSLLVEKDQDENFNLREYFFKVKWYYLYAVVGDLLDLFSKHVNPNELFGEKLYNLLINSDIFKENNSWIDNFQDLKSIDPMHIFISFNSANQKEETRVERLLVFLKIFENGIFSSAIKKIDLSKIIEDIEKFGIDFFGSPMPIATHILSQRNRDDQNIVWSEFLNAINDKEIDFQKVKTVYGIDIVSFTVLIFWARPLKYISLDKNIFSLLENNNKIQELPQCYSDYIKLLTKKCQLLYINLSKIGWSRENQVTLSEYEKEELDSYLKNENNNLQKSKLEKNEFEIIAIKVLKNSDEKYTKNLLENHYYKLNEMYEINNDKILKKESLQNIYSTSNNNNIKVSAIVGKNGSGKSTLAEVLFGFIYNLSIQQNATKEMGQNKYIHLNLEVIFKHDVIYKVVLENSKLEVMRYDEKNEKWSEFQEFNLNYFFYTIGINYSIYANNEKLMGGWIRKIFHKNDAYQTPIVLEPFREDGNIDINEQSSLAMHRLAVNLLKPSDENEEYSLRKLRYSNDYSIAKKLKLKFNNRKIVQNDNSKISEEYIYKNEDNAINFAKIVNANNIMKQVFTTFDIVQDIEFNFGISIKEHSFVGKVQLYILKKIVTIVYRYELYKDYKEFKSIEELIHKLYIDNSHITHKLKRAIYFLKYDLLEKKEVFEINIDQLSKEINSFLSNQKEKTFHQLTPPSFYEIEIFLGKNDKEVETKEKYISFNTLSSGEKQRIFHINALIYHLENINSSTEQAHQYRYVNIILDEIELYYHPEYQRQHLHFLLHNLNKADISKIFGLNIIFITHSPFILTDIINQNVLFLDNHSSMKTFGANMFDIFQDGFFVENSIGSFSQEYIKAISLILSYYQAIHLENIFLLRRLLGQWYSIEKENVTEEEMIKEDVQLLSSSKSNNLKHLKDIFIKNGIIYQNYSYLINEEKNSVIDKLNLYIDLIGDEIVRKHLHHLYEGLLL